MGEGLTRGKAVSGSELRGKGGRWQILKDFEDLYRPREGERAAGKMDLETEALTKPPK